MKWFDRWFYRQVKKAWENKASFEENYANQVIGTDRGMKLGTAMIEKGYPEGQDRISFELTAAVGGRILNVRRYQDKLDRHEHQTYVIPSGEDIGARVAKIINLELIK